MVTSWDFLAGSGNLLKCIYMYNGSDNEFLRLCGYVNGLKNHWVLLNKLKKDAYMISVDKQSYARSAD